jgi:hypothetical protein
MIFSIRSDQSVRPYKQGWTLYVLAKIGCAPRLLSVIQSFHNNMKALYSMMAGRLMLSTSAAASNSVPAPSLFCTLFAVLLQHAFENSTEGDYLHTRSDGSLFNTARLKEKSKVREVTIRDKLFAADAALATHVETEVQRLFHLFAKACDELSLTISLKKTQVMAQNAEPPHITINNYELEAELNQRIGKVSTTLARLSTKVWNNSMITLITNTKIAVYQACVISTILYAFYASQEKRLSAFHMRCLRRVPDISWSDCVTNNDVLERAMCIGWTTAQSTKTSCMESLPQARDQLVVHISATMTSANATLNPLI